MTLVFTNNSQEIITYPTAHDPQEAKYYTFIWKPYTWQPNKLYYVDDIVIPETFNGFYYLCTDPGISGLTSPDFLPYKKSMINDNTIIWKALPYDFHLRHGDIFDVTVGSAPTFKIYNINGILNTNFTISDIGTDGFRCWCKVSGIPNDVSSFILTNEVNVILANLQREKYNRSIIVNVTSL